MAPVVDAMSEGDQPVSRLIERVPDLLPAGYASPEAVHQRMQSQLAK